MNTDCFAYVNRKGIEGCKVLKELYCKDKKCRFYKKCQEVDMETIEREIKRYSVKYGGTNND